MSNNSDKSNKKVSSRRDKEEENNPVRRTVIQNEGRFAQQKIISGDKKRGEKVVKQNKVSTSKTTGAFSSFASDFPPLEIFEMRRGFQISPTGKFLFGFERKLIIVPFLSLSLYLLFFLIQYGVCVL